MTTLRTFAVALLIGLTPALAQQDSHQDKFQKASQELQKQLAEALQELDATMKQVADEKVPLARQLRELEAELAAVRATAAEKTRQLDASSQALGNLTADIKRGKDEVAYLSNLFGEYVRNFESSLHIAEVQSHSKELSDAKLAAENDALDQDAVFAAQAAVVLRSIQRLSDSLGGTIYDGRAVAPSGTLVNGSFALVGPFAAFRSKDGAVVGTVEQKLGSLEPSVTEYPNPETAKVAAAFVANKSGELPIDPTLGSAHKVAETEETLVEHFLKGGPVMWPILAVGVAAGLVALYKWIALSLVSRPSRRQVKALLEAVREKDFAAAQSVSKEMKGPLGEMLSAGVANLQESSELLEEVLFERILAAKLRIQGLLPFLAVSASSAPLLGLLGTVTGIIQTFKQITIYGSGDVKSLSGGISEALITTEYGLIVAIPSLLLHAFLSRKARGIVSEMETLAVQFTNTVGIGGGGGGGAAPATHVVAANDPAEMRAQIRSVIGEILGPALDEDGARGRA